METDHLLRMQATQKLQALESRALAVEGCMTRLPADQLVLAQVQEYLASKYSTLMTENPEDQRQQITAYIAKYLNDYSLGVEGMDHEALIDKL